MHYGQDGYKNYAEPYHQDRTEGQEHYYKGKGTKNQHGGMEDTANQKICSFPPRLRILMQRQYSVYRNGDNGGD